MNLKNLTAKERQVIHALAEACLNGSDLVNKSRETFKDMGIGFDDKEFVRVMRVVEHLGGIKEVSHFEANGYENFWICPETIEMSRELHKLDAESNEPSDIVKQIQESARKNKVMASVIIGFIIITAIVTFTNQTLQLASTISGFFKEPSGQK